jgi:hypothetical protein
MSAFQNIIITKFYGILPKKKSFGHIFVLKKWLIRIFGAITQRYRGFNELQIEGSEI